MGSCVSIHRDADSAMKLRLSFGSKTDKLVTPPFPVNDKLVNGDRPINDPPIKSHWSPSRSATAFRDYAGSREEAFFDTKPWLDSDCEDDFYSVNGDFTPSRGNTPVHHSLSVGSSRMNKTPFEDRIPGPSPTEKKKKLLELFQESFKNDEDADNAVKPTTPSLPPKSVNGTPVPATNSVSSSEWTANGDVATEKEKPIRSVQCCLPSLVSCRSSSQRKKMSPTIAVVDKV
ncbi:PREDICTED: uncharacterized protein At3g27210 isoform X1 [Prunus mume]|uniref:Uncharacterized protein At3g27210 isoform X1 n=1 Tax=Prunus mume TaxID=102107 RepID=A0ABM0NX72_PRUMU|nr:PREDICTED: uncharacterized protein At3g27210 isoform X1 [Prunus mume]